MLQRGQRLLAIVRQLRAAAWRGRCGPSPRGTAGGPRPCRWPSALAPIISTPNFASTPCLSSASAVLSAVWPPMVGQQRVGPLLLDDLGDDLGRDRLDIGCIRQLRVRHDGGRIGVDQDDAVALGLQRLAGLGAGIVELAGLPDDDGARADDEDGFDVCALRHEAASYCSAGTLAIAGCGQPSFRNANRRFYCLGWLR